MAWTVFARIGFRARCRFGCAGFDSSDGIACGAFAATVIAFATATPIAIAIPIATFTIIGIAGARDGGFRFGDGSGLWSSKEFFNKGKESAVGFLGLGLDFCANRARLTDRCGLVGRNAFDSRFRAGFYIRLFAANNGVGFQFAGGLFSHNVAGLLIIQARVVMTQALQLVVWGFQMLVGNHQHVDLEAAFDLDDFSAFLVEKERSHFDGNLGVDGRRIFFHRLFLNDAQDLQGGGFGVADMARAVAARAGDVAPFGKGRTQALARHFHQAEL